MDQDAVDNLPKSAAYLQGNDVVLTPMRGSSEARSEP
jgi:hypothetical protein